MNGFEWVSKIQEAFDWDDETQDLTKLDGLLFKNQYGMSLKTYSFSYKEVINPEKTIVYAVNYLPHELVGGSKNGGPWEWDELKKYFLTGSFIFLHEAI